MRRIAVLALTIATAAVASAAHGEEKPVPLAQGPGVDVVADCNACHSLDYIRINAPFLTRKGWEAEIAKMVTAFGAPIDADETRTIADYLVRNYGKPD